MCVSVCLGKRTEEAFEEIERAQALDAFQDGGYLGKYMSIRLNLLFYVGFSSFVHVVLCYETGSQTFSGPPQAERVYAPDPDP